MNPVVTLGETMGLFRAMSLGSLAQVTDFHLGIGGAESNVAIALSRLGTSVRWLGRIGDDPVGERIVRELRAENVDVVCIVDGSAPTGIMIKEQRTAQTTRVLYHRAGSAGSRLSADDVARAGIETSALLHVTGITAAISPSARDAVFAAISIAEQSAIPVSFDINHRNSLWRSDPSATYREIAARSDIVFAGDSEARLLFPELTSPVELAYSIADLGPTQVIIKLGAEGCVAVIDGVEYVRAAIEVPVVDTVGAGDAFVGGYLSEYVAGLGAEQRLTTAITTGAFACLNAGDWEGYPRRKEFALLGSEEAVTR